MRERFGKLEPMALNEKRQRFVEEYLVDLNATQAAIRAGYSPRTAKQQGQRLLTFVDVQEAIQVGRSKRTERTEITQDRVLEELAKIGFADIRKAVNWGKDPIDATSENADPNGLRQYPVSLIPSEEIDDDTAAAVSEVSLTQAGIKVKMHDKLSALTSIGKHLGMFVERTEDVTPVKTEGELIEQARRLGLDPAVFGLTGGKKEG